MSRTNLDAATLARSLRRMAGDGGMGWCCEPIRASVLLDVADLLDENERLRGLVRDAWGSGHPDRSCDGCDIRDECHDDLERMRKDGVLRYSRCLFELRIENRMREMGIEVNG